MAWGWRRTMTCTSWRHHRSHANGNPPLTLHQRHHLPTNPPRTSQSTAASDLQNCAGFVLEAKTQLQADHGQIKMGEICTPPRTGVPKAPRPAKQGKTSQQVEWSSPLSHQDEAQEAVAVDVNHRRKEARYSEKLSSLCGELHPHGSDDSPVAATALVADT